MRLGFSPVTARMLDVDTAFALAHELEFAFVELSADLYEVAPALQDPKRVRELMRATGLGVTMHLSYVDLNLTSLVPAARATSVERSQRGLEHAHEIEASCGVLHTGMHYWRHPQADPLAHEALAASLRALEGSSVPIALENLALTAYDLLRGPDELREVTHRHGMRNCLDVGHAHIEATRDGTTSIEAYREVLGDDIIHLHLHNNHGQRDEHLPTDQGAIDYRPWRDYLARFEGTICLEIGESGADGVRASAAHMRRLVTGAP